MLEEKFEPHRQNFSFLHSSFLLPINTKEDSAPHVFSLSSQTNVTLRIIDIELLLLWTSQLPVLIIFAPNLYFFSAPNQLHFPASSSSFLRRRLDQVQSSSLREYNPECWFLHLAFLKNKVESCMGQGCCKESYTKFISQHAMQSFNLYTNCFSTCSMGKEQFLYPGIYLHFLNAPVGRRKGPR